MSSTTELGIPPRPITTILRIEGLAVFIAMLAAYQSLGGNWWLFAALVLLPDLSMLGILAGKRAGAWTYNIAHTYALPLILAGIGWVTAAPVLVQIAVIWAAHIGIDRAVGYGLKYPHDLDLTHLGVMGKTRKAMKLADAR